MANRTGVRHSPKKDANLTFAESASGEHILAETFTRETDVSQPGVVRTVESSTVISANDEESDVEAEESVAEPASFGVYGTPTSHRRHTYDYNAANAPYARSRSASPRANATIAAPRNIARPNTTFNANATYASNVTNATYPRRATNASFARKVTDANLSRASTNASFATVPAWQTNQTVPVANAPSNRVAAFYRGANATYPRTAANITSSPRSRVGGALVRPASAGTYGSGGTYTMESIPDSYDEGYSDYTYSISGPPHAYSTWVEPQNSVYIDENQGSPRRIRMHPTLPSTSTSNLNESGFGRGIREGAVSTPTRSRSRVASQYAASNRTFDLSSRVLSYLTSLEQSERSTINRDLQSFQSARRRLLESTASAATAQEPHLHFTNTTF